MKILLIIFIFISSVFATDSKASTAHSVENSRLCKVFKLKAELYKKHMRQDAYAYQTLHSYEQRAEKYCNQSH